MFIQDPGLLSDAKLVVLAMVINIEGFIKYSATHEGNYSDTSDINTLLEKLSGNTSSAKPIVVMDAGVATEKNLNILTPKGSKDLKKIHSALQNQKSKPFKQIKFVVHKPPPKKFETVSTAQFISD